MTFIKATRISTVSDETLPVYVNLRHIVMVWVEDKSPYRVLFLTPLHGDFKRYPTMFVYEGENSDPEAADIILRRLLGRI